MHTKNIIDNIIKKAEEHGNVKRITIQLGALAPVTQTEIEHIAQHRNWRVIVEKVPAVVKCKCGYKGEPKVLAREHDIVLFECPACNGTPDVVQGTEIIISKIEVESEGE